MRCRSHWLQAWLGSPLSLLLRTSCADGHRPHRLLPQLLGCGASCSARVAASAHVRTNDASRSSATIIHHHRRHGSGTRFFGATECQRRSPDMCHSKNHALTPGNISCCWRSIPSRRRALRRLIFNANTCRITLTQLATQ